MYRLSKADVERAAAKVEPRSTEKYSVVIGGRAFPPKQLVEISLNLPPMEFTTMDAQRILTRLGFEVLSLDRQPAAETALQRLVTTAPAPSGSHSQDLWKLAVSEPQEDRALRLKNWLRDTWLESRAIELFESYLFLSGLGKSALQKEPQEGGAVPDFILTVRDKRIALEIKELVSVDFDVASEVELYDPCRPIRERIMAAEYQLGAMRGASRCLVLYSRCTPWPIFDWRLIYGAMRDSDDTLRAKVEVNADQERTHSGPSPLDAVIVLDQLRTGYLRFRAHVGAEESRIGKPLSDTEYVSELHKARGTERDIMLSRLRVIVHQNPKAQSPLPKDAFRGPYDEWYGVLKDGQIGRTFVGEDLQRLDKEGVYRPACA
jgi:hypothetical protein